MIEEYYRIEWQKKMGAILLAVFCMGGSALYLSVGVVPVGIQETIRILLGLRQGIDPGHLLAIEGIRIPRLIASLLVGSGLALSGTAYQSLFQNRLADPFVTGVSAGAVLGCTVAILLGFPSTFLGLGGITLFAFIGAIITSVVVFILLGVLKRVSSATILLIGISLNFFLSAVVSLLLFLHRNRIESIVLWTMGSVASATRDKVIFALPVFLLGLVGIFASSRALDYFVLGEDIARVHGIRVHRVRFRIILFASLLTSVCVSLSGIVGFVGLVTPNMARILTGTRHRPLLVYAALLGALFFLGSDLLAKTLLSPSEIPVGVVTSLVGVPVFASLVWRSSRRIY